MSKHHKQVSALIQIDEVSMDNPCVLHMRCDLRFQDFEDVNAFFRLVQTKEDRETLWPARQREFLATFTRLHKDRGLGEL